MAIKVDVSGRGWSDKEWELMGYIEMEDLSETRGTCIIEPLDGEEEEETTPAPAPEPSTEESDYLDDDIPPPPPRSGKIKMTAIFPCGNLDFVFVRDVKKSNYYVESIVGSLSFSGKFLTFT